MAPRVGKWFVAVTSLLLLRGCGSDGIVPPDFPATRKFVYPASVGKTWVYVSRYYQMGHGYAGGNKSRRTEHHRDGIQTWVVQSMSIQGNDTIVHLTSAKHDTVHLYAWDITSDTIRVSTLDSVYLADTTIHFTMRLSPDTISVNFRPTLYSWFWGDSTLPSIENFYRTLGANSDTVTAPGPHSSYTAHYVSRKGLIDCYLWASGNSYSISERLDLLR